MDAKSLISERPDRPVTSVPATARPEPSERIDPRAIRAWRVNGAVSAALVLAMTVAFGLLVRWLEAFMARKDRG